MSRNQLVSLIWVAVATVYGVGSTVVQEQWWIAGGAAVIVILAVTNQIWRQWLPDSTNQ